MLIGRSSKEDILLFSSGMDSLIAYYLLDKPQCLHISGHSKYSNKEFEAVKSIKDMHPEMVLHIIDGQFWLRRFEEPDSNILFRNAHFALMAAHFGKHVYMPCQLGEQEIPDRSPGFFEDMSRMLTYLGGQDYILDPVFPYLTKQDMTGLYLAKGYPKEELWKTYSCESAKPGRCGQCKMCARAAIALDYCNILPEDFFVGDIWKWPDWQDFIRKMRNGLYEKRRTEQTLNVLNKRGLV